jgi:uncharacterized membrane protein HdeD (DUF308 family)
MTISIILIVFGSILLIGGTIRAIMERWFNPDPDFDQVFSWTIFALFGTALLLAGILKLVVS